MSPKKVLVIGGGGYIGSALLRRLLDRGWQVRLLDVFVYGKEPIESMLTNPNLEIIEGDFRQIECLIKGMQGVGTVVHLGAIVGDPACALNEDLTLEVNLVATRLIADVASAHGVKRLIFASTCSVYGANDIVLGRKIHAESGFTLCGQQDRLGMCPVGERPQQSCADYPSFRNDLWTFWTHSL